MTKNASAKAWDNRIGCAVAIDVMKNLKDTQHENIAYSVATVQEEVGLRGAKTAAATIQPDIGFAIDVGVAGDTPGITEKQQKQTWRRFHGFSHKGLRDFVVQTADELNIPYQYDSMPGGGTDAGGIHLTGHGVPSLSIGIPSRYIHTHAAMIHRDDYENAVKLLTEVIKRLDQKTVEQITYGS